MCTKTSKFFEQTFGEVVQMRIHNLETHDPFKKETVRYWWHPAGDDRICRQTRSSISHSGMKENALGQKAAVSSRTSWQWCSSEMVQKEWANRNPQINSGGKLFMKWALFLSWRVMQNFWLEWIIANFSELVSFWQSVLKYTKCTRCFRYLNKWRIA